MNNSHGQKVWSDYAEFLNDSLSATSIESIETFAYTFILMVCQVIGSFGYLQSQSNFKFFLT